MHGLTGGSWKRSELTTATEKNDPTGNRPVHWVCDLPPSNATAPVPDPPPDVLGHLLSAAGEGGGDTEAAWRGDECWDCHGGRQGRPNGGGHGIGKVVEPMFHEIPMVTVRAVLRWMRWDMPAALLERLGA